MILEMKLFTFINPFILLRKWVFVFNLKFPIEKINNINIEKFSLIKKDEEYINQVNNNLNLYDENNMGYIYKVISVKNNYIL